MIDRYHACHYRDHVDMETDDEGSYVRYTDHAEALAAAEARVSELEAIVDEAIAATDTDTDGDPEYRRGKLKAYRAIKNALAKQASP